VIPALDARTIYEVPMQYHAAGFDNQVCRHFGIEDRKPDLSRWEEIVHRVIQPDGEVSVAIVGKYTTLHDSYKSLIEALTHGGIANNVKVNLSWVDAEVFETDQDKIVPTLAGVNAILVPGAFGERGAQGKIEAIRFARERKVPYFGICFGMQMAVVEAARNLVGLPSASSTEFGPCQDAVVGLMTEWMRGNELERRAANGELGGTMRLGAYECDLSKDSLVRGIYGKARIAERHRHRYEVNVNYRPMLEKVGIRFSGMSPDGVLPEIIEVPDHPWFVGVQFHPELKSRPFEPHPLFTSFIEAAVEQSRLV
jgi:CTP synthase